PGPRCCFSSSWRSGSRSGAEIDPASGRSAAMDPIVWNFTGKDGADSALHRGATKRRSFTFALPGATAENDWQPRRDLPGCEARMELRPAPGEALILSLSEVPTEDGQIDIDGPNGMVSFFISKVGSAKLEAGTVSYDIFLEYP